MSSFGHVKVYQLVPMLTRTLGPSRLKAHVGIKWLISNHGYPRWQTTHGTKIRVAVWGWESLVPVHVSERQK